MPSPIHSHKVPAIRSGLDRLVVLLTHTTHDSSAFHRIRTSVDVLCAKHDYYGRPFSKDVQQNYENLAHKFDTHNQDQKAYYLRRFLLYLGNIYSDTDSQLYLVLQLLWELSLTPTKESANSNSNRATDWLTSSEYIPPRLGLVSEVINPLRWTDILDEEPLVGDHWQTPVYSSNESDGESWSSSTVHSPSQSPPAVVSDRSQSVPDDFHLESSKVMVRSTKDTMHSVGHNDESWSTYQRWSLRPNQAREALDRLAQTIYWESGIRQPHVVQTVVPTDAVESHHPNALYDPHSLHPLLTSAQGHPCALTPSLPVSVTYYTEATIIREMVRHLLGVTSLLTDPLSPDLEEKDGTSRQLFPTVHVRHLSHQSLANLCQSFFALGERVFRIRKFINRHTAFEKPSNPHHTTSYAAQALAAELRDMLTHHYVHTLEQLERDLLYDREALWPSLLLLKHHLEPISNTISLLDTLVTRLSPTTAELTTSAQLTTIILDTLVHQVTNAALCGGRPETLNVLLQLIRRTLRPYIAILVSWLTSGDLDDPLGEFFITIDDNDDAQGILRDHCPALFQPLCRDILHQGNEVRWYRQLMLTGSPLRLPPGHPVLDQLLDVELESLCVRSTPRPKVKFTIPGPDRHTLGALPSRGHVTEHSDGSTLQPSTESTVSPNKLEALLTTWVTPHHTEIQSAHLALPSTSADFLTRPLSPPSAVNTPVPHRRRASQLPVFRIQTVLSEYLARVRRTIGPQTLVPFSKCQRWRIYFSQLCDLYLMMDGTLFKYFSDQLFEHILQRQVYDKPEMVTTLLRNLNGWVDESLLQHPQWHTRTHTVHLTLDMGPGEPWKLSVITARSFLTRLRMHLALPRVMQMVFPSKVISQSYQMIQRFLWYAQFVRFLLLRPEFFKPFRFPGQPRVSSGFRTSSIPWPVRQAQRSANAQVMDHLALFYGLRVKLLAFVNALQYYLWTNVLQDEARRMEQRLETWFHAPEYRTSLTEIVTHHHDFTKLLLRRCLLDDKSAVIRKHVFLILDMVPQFYELYHSYCATLKTLVTPVDGGGIRLPPAVVSLTSDLPTDFHNANPGQPNPSLVNHLVQLRQQTGKLVAEFERTREFLVTTLQLTAKHPGFQGLDALALSLVHG
ncbi:hypothetical protein IWQ62_003676 [Dispira parvispora]|uniref:Spindle pole body component n=1 Tax=Dispira parvispora TaxID=1520584 RepID=A0A9W8E6U9_9FUNG|nr:hypothetical protein IWQ62_003676 [Dispira parvispora]